MWEQVERKDFPPEACAIHASHRSLVLVQPGVFACEARPGLHVAGFARDRFRASASKSCNREFTSKRLSVTPCPGSGSFARCFPSFSPYCRTSSVGGGRSTVSRSLCRSLSIPIRVVPPARASWRGVWGQNLVCVHVCM